MCHRYRLRSVTFAAAMALASAAAAEPIVVIAPFNLTGDNAVLDLPAFNGAKLAAEALSRGGGLLGRPMTLIAVDTASDVTSVTAKVDAALAANPNAVAGIGYSYSQDALAAGGVFQDAALPFITPGATAPDLPDEVGTDMFLAAYGDDAQAAAMATYAFDQLGVRRVAVWIDDSRVYTRTVGGFFHTYFEESGGTVSQHRFSGDTSDFSGLIEELKQADPAIDAIYGATMPASAVPLIAQIRDAGLDIPLLSGDGWDDAEIVAASKADGLSEIYFTTHRFLGVDTQAMQAFVADYAAAYGTPPPNAFAALGYDSVNLLADAITRAGSTDPAAIRAALAETTDFDGVVGRIGYAPGKRVSEKAVAIIAIDAGVETPMWTWSPQAAAR